MSTFRNRLPILVAITIAALGVGLAFGWIHSDSHAAATASGHIVGRENTGHSLELTVLPDSGNAPAYGVRVIGECFDAVANGDPWPNSIAACR